MAMTVLAGTSTISPSNRAGLGTLMAMRRLLLASLVLSGVLQADEFTDFRQQYTTLATIAGNGAKDDQNDWSPTMEGQLATQADLSRPHMAMADDAGLIYIADKEAHAIRKVGADGKIQTIAGIGRPGFNGDGDAKRCTLTLPNGLYALPNGVIYILDLGNDRIRKLDLKGQLTTVLHDPKGIVIGRGLWVHPQEDLIYYCSNSELRSWRPQEGIRTVARGFVSLGNIAVDASGQLYATDRGAGRAYKITPKGKAIPLAGNGKRSGGGHGQPALETAMPGCRGIVALENGALLLATHAGGDIWYVATDGRSYLFLEGEGRGNWCEGDGEPLTKGGKKLSEPRAIVQAPNKDLIITTNDTGYVRVVRRLRPLEAGTE